MSKLTKFRRDPSSFFRDSQSRWVRRLGRVATPLLRRELVSDVIREPQATFARLPLVGVLARAIEEPSRRRRRQLIRSAGSPRVSVVMAAHNAERTIGAAVSSILEQTHIPIELIVIDDASTDGTVAVVEEFADRRISLRRSEPNRGAAFARNLGLAVASGEFVTFQDADDRSHPQRIECQLAALLEAGSAVVSVCAAQREDEKGRALTINGRRVRKAFITMLFHRETVLQRIGYMRALQVSEDSEYYARLLAAFGDDSEVELTSRLYTATFSNSSLLFSDGTISPIDDRELVHRPSDAAARAWQQSIKRIDRIRAGHESPFVARWS